MKNELVLSHPVSVAVSSTIDGLEMGVLSDGRAYLTGRALARFCGVAFSTIINQADRWLHGERSNKLALLLVERGLERPSLYVDVDTGRVVAGSSVVHAYPDEICTALLEYYAFDANPPSDQAQANLRKLLRGGLRLFVYHALGYDPSNRVPDVWRQFHDRVALHKLPFGFFSVFRELSEFTIAAIQGGLPCDEHTIPDISVGRMWSSHWEEKDLEARFGARSKTDHSYPDYFPQAVSNPQPIWVYPISALGEFRSWLMTIYVPTKLPNYLKTKVSKGVLPASIAEMLLAEVTPAHLTSPKGDK